MKVIELMEAGSVLDAYATARATIAGISTASWRPPHARALRHAAQMFRALEYLHSRVPPMVHRDVKPANLLVSADLETIKLADFGVLRASAERPYHHYVGAIRLRGLHTLRATALRASTLRASTLQTERVQTERVKRDGALGNSTARRRADNAHMEGCWQALAFGSAHLCSQHRPIPLPSPSPPPHARPHNPKGSLPTTPAPPRRHTRAGR